MTKICGSKFGGLLWRHPTLRRKTAIWVHNDSSSSAQKIQRYFEKITSCMTFGVHRVVPFRAVFLDYLYELLQLLSALCRDVQKILYGFTSSFSALNYCGGMFFKSLSYLYEVVHTKFFADFWTFRNFDRNFANENRNFPAFLKGQSSSNKMVKIQSKSIHKQRHNTCSNYSARTNGPSNSERDKQKTNIIFSHLQPARVVRSPPNFAW